MPSLIWLTDRDGKVIGTCDARCYDGTGTACKCLCGGANHGIGLMQAARNALHQHKYHPEGVYNLNAPKPWTLHHHGRLSVLSHPQFPFSEG